jgi:TPR repeat protein
MNLSKLHNLFGIVIAVIFLIAMPHQSQAASNNKHKTEASTKERLVLMPLRLGEEDKSRQAAMEIALLEGLQQKYEVFSGEQVAQKAHEIFLKESRNTAHTECDETRCLQNIAEAFQSELLAIASVSKQEDGYFLALSIQNIFDNKVVYSKSVPCKNCDAYQVVEKLKELSGAHAPVAVTTAAVPMATLDTKSKSRIEKDDEQADAKAQTVLGLRYRDGEGVTRDYSNAANLFQKAASKGNIEAQAYLGMMYVRGDGVAQDYTKGVYWCKKAADQGNAFAQSCLGQEYLNGHGIPKDTSKAMDLFLKSSAQGSADASSIISLMYENGDGIPKNSQKALVWLKKAADQGDFWSQHMLAQKYERGDGMSRNMDLAVALYKKAAAHGDDEAQVRLAQMYAGGDYLARDIVLAYAWFNIVASIDIEDLESRKIAISGRSTLVKNMSSAEVAEDERLSTGWKKGELIEREVSSGNNRAGKKIN